MLWPPGPVEIMVAALSAATTIPSCTHTATQTVTDSPRANRLLRLNQQRLSLSSAWAPIQGDFPRDPCALVAISERLTRLIHDGGVWGLTAVA
jgi:hypothetical protein